MGFNLTLKDLIRLSLILIEAVHKLYQSVLLLLMKFHPSLGITNSFLFKHKKNIAFPATHVDQR